jgi:hypothetical protein
MQKSIQLYATAALPQNKEPLVTIELEAAWASDPVWTLWKRGKPVAPAGC